MESNWPNDLLIKLTIYHSQQLLLLRHEQESLLDHHLDRKDENSVFQHKVIREILDQSQSQNITIIVVATPVEEVGRDHDFWRGLYAKPFLQLSWTSGAGYSLGTVQQFKGSRRTRST